MCRNLITQLAVFVDSFPATKSLKGLKMWNKPCFRSSVGHDVVDNKFTVSSVFRTAVGFIQLLYITERSH